MKGRRERCSSGILSATLHCARGISLSWTQCRLFLPSWIYASLAPFFCAWKNNWLERFLQLTQRQRQSQLRRLWPLQPGIAVWIFYQGMASGGACACANDKLSSTWRSPGWGGEKLFKLISTVNRINWSGEWSSRARRQKLSVAIQIDWVEFPSGVATFSSWDRNIMKPTSFLQLGWSIVPLQAESLSAKSQTMERENIKTETA